MGRPWHNRHSSCTTNVYKLDAYDEARWLNSEFRQCASMVPCPCGLTMVNNISPPLNLASRDFACTAQVESTINQQLRQNKTRDWYMYIPQKTAIKVNANTGKIFMMSVDWS